MKRIERELPVKDKTKNYVLQLERKGRKRGREEGLVEPILRLLRNGSCTSFNCNVLEVSEEYVNQSFDGE